MKYERLTERVGKGISVKETSTSDNRSIWNAIERLAELEKQMCKNEDLHTATEKLNDTIILKQFAERLKEKLKEKVNVDNVDGFVECSKLISETLKEFMGEK